MALKEIMVCVVIFCVIVIAFSNVYMGFMVKTGGSYINNTSPTYQAMGNISSIASNAQSVINATKIDSPADVVTSFWAIPSGLLNVLVGFINIPNFIITIISATAISFGIDPIFVLGFSIIVIVVVCFYVLKAIFDRGEI